MNAQAPPAFAAQETKAKANAHALIAGPATTDNSTVGGATAHLDLGVS
jgi:hypothetical protein